MILVVMLANSSVGSRSILIQQLLIAYENAHNPNPIYFYCARSSAEPRRADPESILLKTIKQMCCLEPGKPMLGPE